MSSPAVSMAASRSGTVPRGTLDGFLRYFRYDIGSGFLVFLIALPLCLGIATASNHPPIAGVITAVVGSLLATFLSNAELTIKGPAAGLIVITMGCINDFGFVLDGDPVTNKAAYQAALAVGVAAGVVQLLFALGRLGVLQEFFPSSVVHGMLAAIGVIIISKQSHVLLGVKPHASEPLHLLAEIPRSIVSLNPEIAVIGLVSLAIMFGWPLMKWAPLRRIPSQLLVVLIAIPIGMWFHLEVGHSYLLGGKQYQLDPAKYLVTLPDDLLHAITFPDFSALQQGKAWFWVMLYSLIGSLESLLSAKAVELLDPWKRKTSFNRELFAVGFANTCAACIGGLPMISEIVRSRANIDNGARTRFSNLWHGIFLFGAILLIPHLLHRIPLAALAAMLVFTGYRLASPREFLHVYHVGREQLLIFVATLVGVLATDLLIGVFIGIGVKMIVHTVNGVSLAHFFKPFIDIEERGPDHVVIKAAGSAVFSNWIPFRNQLASIGLTQRKNITVDFTNVQLVDCSVMEKLDQLRSDFELEGLKLEVVGLDTMRQLSDHQFATRRAGLATLRRLTVVVPAVDEDRVIEELLPRGVSGFTTTPCRGAGRHALAEGLSAVLPMSRIEIIASEEVCRALLNFVESELRPGCPLTACLETVQVARAVDFAEQRFPATTGPSTPRPAELVPV